VAAGPGPVVHDARRWDRDEDHAPVPPPPTTAPSPPARPPGVPDVDDPAPLLRIGTMIHTVLEESRGLTLDERARERLQDMQRRAVDELTRHLGPELREELQNVRLALPADHVPDQVALRIAQAGLVGWLEGLFQGAQVAIAAQQSAAGAQLAQLRRDALTRGGDQAPSAGSSDTYL
jgi:hypothetical protein